MIRSSLYGRYFLVTCRDLDVRGKKGERSVLYLFDDVSGKTKTTTSYPVITDHHEEETMERVFSFWLPFLRLDQREGKSIQDRNSSIF